jgi:dihydrofolate reductase
MKFFKAATTGKVVIMGRETFESLPGKEPLKDRVNIVLSRNQLFNNENVIICRSLTELFVELKKRLWDDVFVIGGESIYIQLLPYCSEALVTRIEKKYNADKHFVNLDQDQKWEKTSKSGIKNYNNINFSFLKYINKSIQAPPG